MSFIFNPSDGSGPINIPGVSMNGMVQSNQPVSSHPVNPLLTNSGFDLDTYNKLDDPYEKMAYYDYHLRTSINDKIGEQNAKWTAETTKQNFQAMYDKMLENGINPILAFNLLSGTPGTSNLGATFTNSHDISTQNSRNAQSAANTTYNGRVSIINNFVKSTFSLLGSIVKSLGGSSINRIFNMN